MNKNQIVIAIVTCSLFLGGCANTVAISDISGDKVEVTVDSYGGGPDKALTLSLPEAVRGCSRYEKKPELLSSRRVVRQGYTMQRWILLYACTGADIVRAAE